MQEITMSIPQFCQLHRGELTLAEIKKENNVESLLQKIMSNEQLNKIAIITTAAALHFQKLVLANTDGLAKIDAIGFKFLTVIQHIGYWVCIIMCLVEIIKNVSSGDYKKIGAIIAKYLLILAALYGLQWAFDFIRSVFQGGTLK